MAVFQRRAGRAGHLWALRQGFGADAGRLDVETFLFHFRMFIESLCVMARYGKAAHADLSKTQRKAYHPRKILDDLTYLQDVRLIGLETFAATPDSHDDDIGLTVVYGAIVTLDAARLGALHGQLGEFAHVTSTLPDEAHARRLFGECLSVLATLSPLLKRHMLEVSNRLRVEDAVIDGVALILGQDDAGRDWFVQQLAPGEYASRRRPLLS